MTVSSDISKIVHVYNPAVREYPYNFKIFAEKHLRVICFKKDSPGHDLLLGTDYSVQGLGSDAGGAVTLTAAGAFLFAGGDLLVIMRKMMFVQETRYKPGGKFPAESHELALDILTMQNQELLEMIRRSLIFPEYADGTEVNFETLLELKNEAEAARDEAAGSADEAGRSADEAKISAARAASSAAGAAKSEAGAANSAGRAEAAKSQAEAARDDAADYADIAAGAAVEKSSILTDCYCSLLHFNAALVNFKCALNCSAMEA